MNPPGQNVQEWRDYFLRAHSIVFVRNDPDSGSVPFNPQILSGNPVTYEAASFTRHGDSPFVSQEGSSSTELYSRKSATELLMEDQRRFLYQIHSQEMSRVEEKWQHEVSRHLSRITELSRTLSDMEQTISR